MLSGSLEEPDADQAAGVLSSPHVLSKWAATNYAGLIRSLFARPVVVARLFMVYGPGQRDPRKLIPGAIASFLRGEAPCIFSGKRPVDWVFIGDVVEGRLAAWHAPRHRRPHRGHRHRRPDHRPGHR